VQTTPSCPTSWPDTQQGPEPWSPWSPSEGCSLSPDGAALEARLRHIETALVLGLGLVVLLLAAEAVRDRD
jgi:hypothetical protein